MEQTDLRTPWEDAAPGWARWDATIAPGWHLPPMRMSSAAKALAMMQDAFGAYRAVISDGPEAVRVAA